MRITGLLWLLAASAASGDRFMQATLTGSQEVPAVSTLAFGQGIVILYDNDATNVNDDTIDFVVTFTNLTTGWNLAHIHGPASPGGTAGVIFDLPSNSTTQPPALATSGTFAGSARPITSTTSSTLRNNQGYFNIHSTTHGGGEIRGQIIVTAGATGTAVSANGAVVLEFSVTSGAQYRVQSSSDLLDGAGWIDISTNRATSELYQFTEPGAGAAQRSFRLVSP